MVLPYKTIPNLCHTCSCLPHTDLSLFASTNQAYFLRQILIIETKVPRCFSSFPTIPSWVIVVLKDSKVIDPQISLTPLLRNFINSNFANLYVVCVRNSWVLVQLGIEYYLLKTDNIKKCFLKWLELYKLFFKLNTIINIRKKAI